MNENQEILRDANTELWDLSNILNQSYIQSVMLEPEFYFQKGQDALNEWIDLIVSDELKNTLINLSKDYIELQKEASKREDLNKVLTLLFKIVSYCDTHAKDKNLYNLYADKRTLAFAFVRMNNWIEKLIQFKFIPDEVGVGSPQNAFNYLLDPSNNSTMLSENHRQQLAKNFLKKPYYPNEFVSDFKSYFKDYNLATKNPQNYTHLLMLIAYSLQDKWKEKKPVNGATQFSDIIEQVKAIAEDNQEIQNLFVFEKTEKKHVWIKDNSGLIGNAIAHYEIIRRIDKLNVEVHFEGKQKEKDIFRQNIEILPNKLEWFKWNNSSSIRLNEDFDINETDIAEKLLRGLLYIEDNIGDQLRETIKSMSSDQKSGGETQPLNQILYGPPGTGKTYNTVNKALAIANPDFNLNQPRYIVKQEFDRLMKDGQIVFTTFHQNMSYEDFIEGIKPLKPEISDGFVKYDIVHGIFKRLCRKAETPPNISFDIAYKKLLADLEEKDEIEVKNSKVSFKIKASENGEDLGVISNSYIKNITKEGLVYVSKSKSYVGTWGQYYKAFFQFLKEKYGYKESANTKLENHVIIIDEINRGNISQIFGELITLIEEDKRIGEDEALEVTLPYSKEKFGVPASLYIIGTMNTADRSVEALDTALRRRFIFVEIPPNSALIATDGKLKDNNGLLNGIDLPLLLDTINKRILKLLDKDHQIGHSYFMRVGNLDDLKIVFHNKIIPLLQEYFFGDYGKAGLVLGEDLFEPMEDQSDDLFADFNGYDASEFAERPVYKVKDIINMQDADFIKAINILLRK